MKSVLIASMLIATTFAASAMSGNGHIWSNQEAAAGPGKTRAEVIAELQAAQAAGLVNLTDAAMRQADSLRQQTQTSSLTREQVRQEVLSLQKQGLLNIQGEH